MYDEFANLICQSQRPYNGCSSWGYLKETKPLTLLHFSDIHSDATEFCRVCDFIEKYGDLMDDAICTGDMLELRWSSDFLYWENEPRSSKIMMCIGNHDVLTDENGWNWANSATSEECYNRFLKKNISNWNCVYENNKTYYYKNYTDKRIRMIVLDCMLKNGEKNEQLLWFKKVLSSARINNLSVIAVNHYPIHITNKIDCNFSTLDKETIFASSDTDDYQEEVQKFIDEGGNFISWITGHSHNDFIGYNEKYKEQLCIVNNALCREQCKQYSDLERIDGTVSQDLFNVITFDLSSDLIKIIRVGANLDRYLRKRDTICINYKTYEVIK